MISIILPTYNGAKWIRSSIESVQAQSYGDWELLVIDDGSVDNTKEIVGNLAIQDSRIRYIKNEKNLGIQKTLNRGLKEAKGEYIARIDDDDRWIDKEKIQKQLTFLEENSNYVLVGTGTIVVDEEGHELFRYLGPKTDKEIRNRILSKNCFTHSSVMFKKTPAIQCGGYSESQDVIHLEDYDLWLKLGMIGKFHNLSIYGTQFTLRDEGMSVKNKPHQFKKNIKLVKFYKDKYPNYFKSLLFNYFKFFAYKIYSKISKFIPLNYIKNKIMSIYK